MPEGVRSREIHGKTEMPERSWRNWASEIRGEIQSRDKSVAEAQGMAVVHYQSWRTD